MEKKEKRIYEAPSLTVATFKAEAGYAQSLRSLALWQWADGQSVSQQRHMEDYTVGNSWDQSTNAFWD